MIEHGLLLAMLLFEAGRDHPQILDDPGNSVLGESAIASQLQLDEPTLQEILYRVDAFSDSGEYVPPSVRQDLMDAVVREVVDGTTSAADVLVACRNLSAPMLLSVVDGLARTEEVSAVAALARLIGQREGMDVFVLDAIARLARVTGGPHSEEVLLAVRFGLNSNQAIIRRHAAAAAGALGDDDAVQVLILMLEDSDPLCVAEAHGALVEHIRFPFAPRVDLWQAWYDEERRFLDEEFAGQVTALRGPKPALRVTAAKSIAAGRLGRDERTRALVEALPFIRQEGLQLQVITGLRSLGSPIAEPVLEDFAREHEEESIRDAAGKALAVIRRGKGPKGKQTPP